MYFIFLQSNADKDIFRIEDSSILNCSEESEVMLQDTIEEEKDGRFLGGPNIILGVWIILIISWRVKCWIEMCINCSIFFSEVQLVPDENKIYIKDEPSFPATDVDMVSLVWIFYIFIYFIASIIYFIANILCSISEKGGWNIEQS